jgi:hypothetical protein
MPKTYDLGVPMKNLDGEEIREKRILADGSEEIRPAVANRIIANVLANDMSEVSGEEKARRFKLAQVFYSKDEVEISPEDVVLIKQLVAKNLIPLVVSQIYDILG